MNMNPKRLTFQLGGYITAAIGLVIMPWKLIESAGAYIFTWLIGYSALLGPIGAILIVDYFMIRKTELDVDDLFQKQGRYWYSSGFNPVAIIAFVLAVLPNLPGFLHVAGAIDDGVIPPFFDEIYTYAWFVGFGIAGVVYYVGMKLRDGGSLQKAG